MNDVETIPVLEARHPMLLFGGCYSNLQATRALLQRARELGIPADHIVCTGDVVAYAADPAATVGLIRDAGVYVVMGNCEESFGQNADDCGCGFASGSACDLLSIAWYAHADRMLDEDARAWMRGLPRRIDIMTGPRRLAVIHGSPASINQFVFASAPDATFRALIESSGCDGVIGGHCGIPFTRLVDGLLWHNPGAIGIPANDGTKRVWFSVLRALTQGIELTHYPLEYDNAAAAGSMLKAGLPAGYADAMRTGLWPSLDVLPPAEVVQTGVPLTLGSVIWPAMAAVALAATNLAEAVQSPVQFACPRS